MGAIVYFSVFAVLVISAVGYFAIAKRFNIVDKPNARSSHNNITIRGGGVLFPLAGILFFVSAGFPHFYFFSGLLLIAVVSFLDDITHLPLKVRLSAQFLAIFLMLYEANVLEVNGWLMLLALVVATGTINAYNFMDGINGITSLYSLVVLLGLWLFNQSVQFISPDYLYFLALANVVFLFFNFRPKGSAKCFAGDVGSVSLAFLIIFPLILLIIKTQNLLYILLLLVYGVDSVVTILYRLRRKENIFEAHRTHLYQYLANEAGWSHQIVSFLYAVIQLGFIALLYFGNTMSVLTGSLLYVLAYIACRQYVIKRYVTI